jgi:hypothetical protein
MRTYSVEEPKVRGDYASEELRGQREAAKVKAERLAEVRRSRRVESEAENLERIRPNMIPRSYFKFRTVVTVVLIVVVAVYMKVFGD